jgi:CheY-like chemotaxis protein
MRRNRHHSCRANPDKCISDKRLSNLKASAQRQTAVEIARPQVLIAEDVDEMRILLANAFLREGYHVTECIHGVDLLIHLKSFLCPQDMPPENWEDFDLIVSDIRMPGVSALEVIEGIQQFGGLPPIILLTAFGDRDTHLRAYELGVAAVFNKPFEFDDLLAKARELVPPPQFPGE